MLRGLERSKSLDIVIILYIHIYHDVTLNPAIFLFPSSPRAKKRI